MELSCDGCFTETQLNDNSVVVRVDAPYAYVVDVADIHNGAILHNRKSLKQMIQTIQNTENMFWIGGGDSTENAQIGSKSSVYDEKCHGIDQILELRDLLKPIADKCLFIKDGNHGLKRSYTSNKIPPEYVLAELLGVKFIRGIGIALINVKKNLYSIGAIHTPRKTEASFDWLNVDALFIEHQHTRYFNRLPIAYLNRIEKRWAIKPRLYLRSGSFLDWGGYSGENYRPLYSEGGQVLRLSGDKHNWDMRVYERVSDFREDMA